MSRLRWPDSTNSVSEKPGTIQVVGSHLRRWFRCSCGFSWRASPLASALARGRSATGSTHMGPAAGSPNPPAEELHTSPRLPPRVTGHDDQELVDDLATWLDLEGLSPHGQPAQTQSGMLSAILDNPAIAAQPIVDDRPPEGTGRATRYQVTLPLQYRRKGAPQWHSAFTENVSRSGMLFRFSEDPLGLAKQSSSHGTLELSLKLRRIGVGTAPGPIRRLGAVVRVEPPGALRAQTAVAVAFDAYRQRSSS